MVINIDFFVPFQGSSSMCIATLDIYWSRPGSEIYSLFFNTSNDFETATCSPFFYYHLRGWRHWCEVIYVTETSCSINWIIWIPISAPVYQFLVFNEKMYDDLRLSWTWRGKKLYPWIYVFSVQMLIFDFEWQCTFFFLLIWYKRHFVQMTHLVKVPNIASFYFF